MNHILKAVTCKLPVVLVASLLSSTVAAQGVGSVVESQPFTPGQSRSVSSAPSNSNNDALSLLLDQIRDLQSEVQSLRAMVEEQSFELRKMQRDSLSRYTNVDDRLSGLESGAAASVPGVATRTSDAGNAAAAPPVASNTPALNQRPISSPRTGSSPAAQPPTSAAPRAPATRNIGRGTLEPAILSEQQLYQMAYDSVIKSNFDLSIAEFDQYLSIYPSGRFVTNAHYWKGQAYLYLNRYNEAVESYEIIVNGPQDVAKLPDAMYGLALAYEGMGNNSQARALLNDIKRRFPNTGVANLADTRLLSLD
ncbi:tetratricopeptide repeat protein [Gammaproteobacteria bacterium]|jgi:tol-pal system protein YbgF|nr:tetratricopeptide repeat protein [Pseudomonadales bacterium]MDC0413640.1 tetratricopeptide repeat protein [Gammaproteobacteria bacterium]